MKRSWLQHSTIQASLAKMPTVEYIYSTKFAQVLHLVPIEVNIQVQAEKAHKGQTCRGVDTGTLVGTLSCLAILDLAW